MCHIAASFDQIRLKHLVELGEARGNLRYSKTGFIQDKNSDVSITKLIRGPNPLNYAQSSADPHEFILAHAQAPTSPNVETVTAHPAVSGSGHLYLWHNGIIRSIPGSSNLRKEWDTQVLANYIQSFGFFGLSAVVGSFACFLYDDIKKALYFFRNTAAPMFVHDETFDFCSVKFEGSHPVAANTVYKLDLNPEYHGKMIVARFTNVEEPFYFGDEA